MHTVARGLAVAGLGLSLLAQSVPVAAIAGPEFLSYEGRNAIHEGQGGEKKTVDGIDFWMSGEPPHRYQVLGSLTDRRHETGIYGAIRMSSFESDIAKAARAAGGDAVILQAEDEDMIGVAGTSTASVYGSRGFATGFGTGFSRPIKAHDARFLVVRYLPDEPPPQSAAQQTPPGAMAGHP